MLERLMHRVDFLPGMKTIILVVALSVLYWGAALGIVPAHVEEVVRPWLMAALIPTLTAKLVRK